MRHLVLLSNNYAALHKFNLPILYSKVLILAKLMVNKGADRDATNIHPL